MPPIYDTYIVDRQRRGVPDGRIRAGYSTPYVKNGKTYKKPHSLDKWRFTSPSRHAVEVAAEVFGGVARPWDPGTGRRGQWEVFSDAAQVPVVISIAHVFTQWNELWDNGVCLRRCTGGPDAVNEIDGERCACPADWRRRKELAGQGKACKPTTRLGVMVTALPGAGLWWLESHGDTAAIEIPQRALALAIIAAQGDYIPADLVIDRVTMPGRNFVVPRLDIKESRDEIAARQESRKLRELVAGRRPLALPLGSPPAVAPGAPPAQPPAAGPATAPAPPPAEPEDPAAAERRAAWAQWAAKTTRGMDRPRLAAFAGEHGAKLKAAAREFVTDAEGEADVELEVLLGDRRRAAFAQWAAGQAMGMDYDGLTEFYRSHHAEIQDAAGEHVSVVEGESPVEFGVFLADRLRMLSREAETDAA